MGIFHKITSLFAKKHKIEKEIANLQNSCKHINKSVKQVREYGDSTSPVIRWVRNDCSKLIGYPSKQETDKFFRE